MELLNVNEIFYVNGGPWRKATPKGSGSLPTPRSGFASTVILWDIVLCNVVEYKWNTDSCDSYLHVIMTLRPTALHSCPNLLMLSFSLSRPTSSMVGFWQLLFRESKSVQILFIFTIFFYIKHRFFIGIMIWILDVNPIKVFRLS